MVASAEKDKEADEGEHMPDGGSGIANQTLRAGSLPTAEGHVCIRRRILSWCPGSWEGRLQLRKCKVSSAWVPSQLNQKNEK